MFHRKEHGIIAVRVFVLLTCLFVSGSSAQFNDTLEQELQTLLLTTNNYNRFIRPEPTVKVYVASGVYNLKHLDIKDQTMEVVVYFVFYWNDKRLDWSNKAPYNITVKEMFSNEDYIWVPKLTIPNSVEDIEVLNDENYPVNIGQDGTISWVVGRKVKTHCEFDVRFYPFDTQTCGITMSTWLYDKNHIVLETTKPISVLMEFFKENGEWEYLRHSTSDVDTTSAGVTFQQLTFHLTFRRRPSYYFMNYILVGTLLAWLLCFIFKLPVESGEKVGYTLTVLLTYTVYLTIVLDNIPRTSQRTSMLATTMLINIIFGVIATAITIFILRCHNSNSTKPIPQWIVNLVENVFKPFICYNKKGCLCCCCSFKNEKDYNDAQAEPTTNGENRRTFSASDLTWPEIGEIVDDFSFKVSFWILIVVTFVPLFIYLLAYIYESDIL